MPDIEMHRMPNGVVGFYRDSDHSYWHEHDGNGKCSGRVPGASTIAKNDGNTYSDPLINWGVRLDREGIAREASLGLAQDDAADILAALNWLRSPETITKTLEQEKATWEDIREEKGNIGWKAHDVLQALAEGRVPEPESPYDEGVIRWWNARQPEPLQTEQTVFAEFFAGRFDLRCKVGTMPEDKFTATIEGAAAYEAQRAASEEVLLLDAKTGGFVSNAWAIQLNLYRLACIEAGFGDCDRLVVLHLDENARWRELDVPINEEWANAALELYAVGSEIRGELTAQKKAVRWE